MAEDFAIGRALVIPKDVLSNLDEVDKKINKIATDSENMATKFTSAMSKMSVGTGDLLKKLTEMQTKINNMDISKFAQGVSNVAKGVSQIEKFSNAITKAAAAINKYNSSQVNKKNVDNTKEINKLNKEIEALKKKTEQLEQYRQKQQQVNREQNSTRTNTKAIDAYNRAMASSEAIVTQRINKIAKLRQAEEMLTKASGDYSVQIKRIRQEIERLNKLNQGQVDAYGRIIRSQRNLMDTSGQLERKLALIFSVSQIEGYISKLVRVRGEFELQNTALASILQNKDQADKLFGQITELAVKSPFTVKELTTYTKSLSAYSVEYEKLYDTTKMLADVSAGLGVDMQRLILAFGQVKAANFLRGTETRQFTEAGINMLGELAKYYSELEDRIVSVGEVQERQFKRMISSQDVEQVFKRLTSAGGMFYDMQERQAETLAGMMSNLQDSIDLMLNDIGKGNESVIKDMIKNIRSIIENWREVAWYLEKIATAFVVYKGAAMLAALGNSAFVKSLFQLNKTASSTKINLEAMKKVLLSFGRGLASAGLLFLVSWLVDLYRQSTKTSRELEELGKSLNKITSTDASNLNKMVSALDDLIARIKLSNEGSQERRDIISSLNNNYGEYLDFVVDETTSIKDLTDAYDGVVKKMKEKAALATLEKGYQEINQFYEDNLTDARKQFEKELSRGLSSDLGFGGFKKSIKPTKDEINDLFNILQNRIRETDDSLLDSSREQRNLLQDIVKEYYGNGVTLSQDYLKTVPLIDLFLEKKKKEEELQNNINGAYKETLRSREANIALTKRENQLELEKEAINNQQLSSFDAKRKIQEAIEKFELDKIDIKVKFGEISQQEAKRQKDVILNWATNTVKDVNARLREELKGYSEEDLSKVLIGKEEQATGLSSIQQTVKQNWETQVSTIEQLTKLKENNISVDEKLLANAQKLKVMYEAKARILGVELESKKESRRSDNSELQKLKEKISLLKKAGEEYEKLIKTYGVDEANEIVRNAYKDAFSNVSLSTEMTFDTSGIIEGIKKIQYQSIEGGKEVVDKTLAELESEKKIKVGVEGIEEIQKQIDSIFTNYEFSLELKTAGIDSDAFKNMLKSVGATDEEISLAGLDVTTFEQAQKKIREIINDLQKQGGNEQLDLAKKYQEQLTQLEVKEARKRFDELLTLREKYQTNEEKIAKIETDISSWQKELDNIKQLGEAANKEQEELLEMRIQNGNDAILKLKSEALQLTEFWRMLFGDLEDLSVNSLRRLSDTVDEVISSSKEIKGNKGQLVGYSAEYTDKDGLKKQVTLTVEQYQRLLKQNNQVADEIQKKNPFIALFDAIIEGKKEGETKLDYIVRLEGILGDVSNAAFQVASDLAEIFGADEEAKELISNIKGVADGAISLGTGIARIASGDILGGAMSAISGIASIVTSINKIHDNKREQEIEKQTRLVEDLERAYDKLYKTIENGLSIDAYSENANLIKNLTKQVESYQAMIAAEYDKKNTDIDRIRDWENSISDIYEQIDDLYDNLKTNLVGDFKSVSQQLGDAIAEAFANGTDAAEAWGDSVKEIVADMVKNLLVQKLIEPGVQQILDQLFEDAMPKTANADKIKEQMNALMEQYEAIGETSDIYEYVKNLNKKSQINKQLEELKKQYEQAVAESEGEVPNITQDIVNSALGALEQLGDDVLNNPAWDMLKDLLGQEGDTMSSLQRGIEGLSESTGQALEALLNSMRFFVSDSNTVLHNIYNAIAMPNVENPFLMELKVQSNYLNNLNALVGSVIKNSSGKGKVLRVEIA